MASTRMPDTFRSTRPRSSAFTLIELLVVIGIIALLISILLPALSRAQGQARKVKCMSNLRAIGQTLALYASENRSSLPFGSMPSNATSIATSQQGEYYDWISILDYYLVKGARPYGRAAGIGYGSLNKFPAVSEIFLCPEINRDAFRPASAYALHPVAVPGWFTEFDGSVHFFPSGATVRTVGQPFAPAKMGQLFNDNILGWDSHVFDDPSLDRAARTDWYRPNIAESCIDGMNLEQPTSSSLRYRIRGTKDVFQSNPLKRQEAYIYVPRSDADGGTGGFDFNSDPLSGSIDNSQLNNLRFRHSRSSECNVLMGDLSVQTVQLDKRKRHPDFADESYFVNITRAQLRIKKPSAL